MRGLPGEVIQCWACPQGRREGPGGGFVQEGLSERSPEDGLLWGTGPYIASEDPLGNSPILFPVEVQV